MGMSSGRIIGRIGLANLSIATAFVLSFYFSAGGRLLSVSIDLPVLQSIPIHKAHLLLAFANYWIVALLIYLILRGSRAELWLKPSRGIHALIGFCNGLLILYLISRIFASGIQGGGPSFVVAMFAPYFVVPAQLSFAIGIVWLVVRSVANRSETMQRLRPTIAEYVAVTIALTTPIAYVSTLYFGEDAPLRLAREASKIFEAKCNVAGEKIFHRPGEEIRSLFVEYDIGGRYEKIKNGVYSAWGSGGVGEPHVNSGLLLFIERTNDRPRPEDGGQFKYRRHGFQDWKGQPINEIESEYGVYYKRLTGESERKLGVEGVEVSIRHIKKNETIATTTYFVSKRQRKFCGEAPNGYFESGQFVIRALGLEKKYPSAWDRK